MGFFFSADSAAVEVGLSLRHFRRVSGEAGVDPAEFRVGLRKKFMWTRANIDQIKAYIVGPKVRKPQKRYQRKNPGPLQR